MGCIWGALCAPARSACARWHLCRVYSNTVALSLPQPQGGLTLYRGCRSSSGAFQWEEQASGVHARLYDANEDSKRKAEWHLEIEGAGALDIDAVIDDDFMFDLASRRAVFALDSVIWALHSASAAEFEALHRVYEKALFENKWGIEYTPENEAKVWSEEGSDLDCLRVDRRGGSVGDACGTVWTREWEEAGGHAPPPTLSIAWA